jgi:hypothetical protein
MKERPILMSGPMVRAYMAGRKTQTRRIIKDQWHGCLTGDCPHNKQAECDAAMLALCPYGVPGDRLWFRETFMPMPHLNAKAFYRASDPLVGGKWKPAIHMPRALCRFTPELGAVRVERLQSLSFNDAMDEGIPRDRFFAGVDYDADGECWEAGVKKAFALYEELWDSLNAKRGFPWSSNPWVWVVEFKGPLDAAESPLPAGLAG